MRLKECLNTIVVRGATKETAEINVGNSNDLDAFYGNIETILLPQGWKHDGRIALKFVVVLTKIMEGKNIFMKDQMVEGSTTYL